MKIISHRGNLNGQNLERENSPQFIEEAINSGFDVEVDIRYINGAFFLGHDYGQHKVSTDWILNNKNNIWFHCKNLQGAHMLITLDKEIKAFCHSSDPYVLVTTGYIWVHDLELELNEKSIIPLMEVQEISDKFSIVHGVCTDYSHFYKNKFK